MCRQAQDFFTEHTITAHLCWASVLSSTGQAALQMTQVKETSKDKQPVVDQERPGAPRLSEHPAMP